MSVESTASPRGRILLVFPQARANYGSGDLKREDVKVDDLGAVYPPLGPLYVAAATLPPPAHNRVYHQSTLRVHTELIKCASQRR